MYFLTIFMEISVLKTLVVVKSSVFRDVKWCFNASWGLKGLLTYVVFMHHVKGLITYVVFMHYV